LIELDPHEGVSDADVASGRWRGLLEGQFWHELGHALTEAAPEPDPTEELLAYQLLEDVRIERSLVALYPGARPWLRMNTLGRYPTAKSVLRLGEGLGWTVAYATLGARRHAGVITNDEAADIAELAPSAGRSQLAEVDDVFSSDAQGDRPRAELISVLTGLLPALPLY
jgi:hypothetical protein